MQLNDNDELINEWQNYKEKVNSSPTLRPVTLASRDRCRSLGIEPKDLEYRILSSDETNVKVLQNKMLIESARPYMEFKCFIT